MKIEGDIKAKDSLYFEFLEGSSGMYLVPNLQRPYTWGKAQLTELFYDIKDAQGAYYIGSVVIMDREDRESNRDQIIDGQQRLTSLSLLLVALRDFIGNKKGFDNIREDIENMLYRMKVTSGEKLPRLSFSNEQSENVYKAILGGTLTKSSNPAQKVFIDAIILFRKMFKEYSPSCKIKDIEKILDNIRNLQIVVIECKNRSAAFDLFESINATGVTLASNDIIKNRILQIASERGDSDYIRAEKMWSEMEKNLDYDSSRIKTFIRHQWLSMFGYTSHKKLFRDFEKMIGDGREKGSRSSKYLESLLKDSEIYSKFIDVKIDSLEGITNVRFEKDEIKKSLEFLSYLDVDQVYSVLLFLYRNSLKSFRKDLNRMVAFQFLYKNVPGSPSVPEKIFADLTEGKIKKDIMFQKLKKLCDGYQLDFVQNFIKKTKYKEGRSAHVQFILEKYLISRGMGGGFTQPTIEHIIAKSNKDKNLEDYINLIGNLTILEKTDNGSLQDKPFEEKLLVYKKVWKINQQIKKYSFVKNPIEAINKRSEDIAKDIYEMLLNAVSSGKI